MTFTHRPRPAVVAMLGCLWLGLWGAVAAEPARPQRVVLDNGLVILFRPNPSALTLAVCCFIKASARVETQNTAGLRSLAQQMLLDVPDASGQPLQRRAALRGMRVTQQVSADYMETVFLGTTDQLGDALGFTRELFTPPAVNPRNLSIRRTQLLRQVAARRELPETVALDTANANLHRDLPFAWQPVGTTAVAGLEARHIQDFWAMRVAPNNAVVTISGALTWPECLAQARQMLGSLLPRQVLDEPELPTPSAFTGRLVYVPWRGDTAVVTVAAASPGPGSEGFPAAALLNAVLAGGEGSRLFQELRVARGWAYNVSSELVPSGFCGLLAATVSCAPERAADVFQAMRAEVSRLQTVKARPEEVERAKAYLTSGYVLGHQRNAEVAHYLGLFEVLSPGEPEVDLPRMLAAVTTEEVTQAAGWLSKRMVWVQVGGNRPQ